MSAFLTASRLKLRFEGKQGQLFTVEDLWDLPLTAVKTSNLDDIAIALDSKIPRKSFVENVTEAGEVDRLRLDIVKIIIETRLNERKEAALAEQKRAQKQKLLEVLSRKKDGELEGLTVEQLEEKIAAL